MPRFVRLYEGIRAFKRPPATMGEGTLKIAVTGANGFVGGRVAERCAQAGHHVLAIGRGASRADCQAIDARFDQIDWSRLGGLDVLLHFAAVNDTSIRDDSELRRVNVDAAVGCMRHAIAAGCRRIVYASSLHVYGPVPSPMTVTGSPTRPVSAYGRSKLQLEREAAAIAARHGVDCIGLRFANVYGPGEAHKGRMASQVLQIARQMRAGDPEIFSPGTQSRDFVHVDDAAAAAVAAAVVTNGQLPPLLNCGTGDGTTFNDLVILLNAALGLHRTPRYIPEPQGYLREVVLDVAVTRSRLACQPRPLAEGIADYLASGELA
jgi:ADP-L-glycero-D-manno-heptose 6-epimerase